jgi:citrate lyase subunit beta/citryl-CoA lyase
MRSALFVPADDVVKLEKAADLPADAIVIDLEDGVSAEAKSGARQNVSSAAARYRARGKRVVVRINSSWQQVIADLSAAITPAVDAVMVPKAGDPARLQVLGELLMEFEAERRLPMGSIRVIALIEDPIDLDRLAQAAKTSRIMGLALGTEDFSYRLGVAPTMQSLELPCRLVALAAAAHDLLSFAVPVSLARFGDVEQTTGAMTLARAFGTTGALCIHPSQVRLANEIFTPSMAELDHAREVLSAWEHAVQQGWAVCSVGRTMVDAPVVKRALRTLNRPAEDFHKLGHAT